MSKAGTAWLDNLGDDVEAEGEEEDDEDCNHLTLPGQEPCYTFLATPLRLALRISGETQNSQRGGRWKNNSLFSRGGVGVGVINLLLIVCSQKFLCLHQSVMGKRPCHSSRH